MNNVYKIRRRADGLFSSGGSHPSFNLRGKVWKRQGDVTAHMNLIASSSWSNINYNECDVLEFEVVETPVESTPASHWLAKAAARKMEKETARRSRQEAIKKQRRLAEYRELQKEFG